MNEPAFPLDPFFELQLRVARRADELAHQDTSAPRAHPVCWLRAEAEIFGLNADQNFSAQYEALSSAHPFPVDTAEKHSLSLGHVA